MPDFPNRFRTQRPRRPPVEPVRKYPTPFMHLPPEQPEPESRFPFLEEFFEEAPELGRKALEWGVKGLEHALYPFTEYGIQRREQEQPWYLPTLKPPTAEQLTPEAIESRRIGGEEYEEYQALPFLEQIKHEAPAWLASFFVPGAIQARGALAPAAAAGGLKGAAAQVTRTALAPVAGVETAIGAVTAPILKYGIVIPTKYAIKGVSTTTRKAFEVALDTGLDKWIATQARLKGTEAQSVWAKWLGANKTKVAEFATNNLKKRMAQKRGTVRATQDAVDDTIKQVEPLLLKEVEGIKPTAVAKAGVAPVKPTAEVKLPTVDEAIGRFEAQQVAVAARTKYGIDVTKATGAEYVKAGLTSLEKDLEGTGFPLNIKEQTRILKEEYAALPKAPVTPEVKPDIAQMEGRRDLLVASLERPATQLPSGIKKIELRQQLRDLDAKLVPAEKKLRQQIMAVVKSKGLSEKQSRDIFRDVSGKRYLTEIGYADLGKISTRVQGARPVTIGSKKVITLKTEAEIAERKADLIDEGILTEESYQGILGVLRLKTDKYINKTSFITQTEARSIIGEMNKRAILAPLGELKFGKPTSAKYLTSDIYYGQVLGVHPLVEPLELAKVDFDLAYRAMSNAIDKQINNVNKAFGVSGLGKLEAKIGGYPTKGVVELRDLLDKFEEAPAHLTDAQKEAFNWFRNLNRTIISGENEVRRALGLSEITYREAYVRHVPDTMAEEILQGLHPLPPGLEYWSQRLVSKRVFNPMEFHRQLADDLAGLYTKDLSRAAKDMVYTGLKEIHLAQPLKAFTERLGALSDVMPASTKKWVIDFVNQRIKGQQTEWDAGLNRLVTESGFGGLVNKVLAPYHLTLGTQPVTQLAQLVGRMTILSVLGLPRPKAARLYIRNLSQRIQETALHGIISVIKGFAFEKGKLRELMEKSRFMKGYTGVEEWPADLMSQVERIALAPYQTTAVINARQGMRTSYHDFLPLFTKPKYKDFGWASSQRTYGEPKGFLYPEEETLMLAEMELGARATQYQYIGMAMPGIFRNKTLIPLTRLQSWWMNHYFMFHREAAHRLLTGQTRLGHKLPWTKRVNYLIYLLFGGAYLTAMGYGMSYLHKVLPHNLSPVAQFMAGLLTFVGANSDWEREKGKREIFGAWKAMVPGALAWDEFQKLWSGEIPLWQMFFYGKEEEGAPPRAPTWNIIDTKYGSDKAGYDLEWERLYINYEASGDSNSTDRIAYRIANPDVDAALFIEGRVTTLKTDKARKDVAEIVEKYKIPTSDIPGWEKEFGKVEPTTRPTPNFPNRFK